VVQGGRTGWWYVFADATPGPQVPMANATGPIAVAAAPADDKTKLAMGDTCNDFALNASASGHNQLGSSSFAGVGATLSPLSGGMKSTVDFSAYDGIQFDIKAGAGTQGPIYFEILTTESQPGAALAAQLKVVPTGTATNLAVDGFNTRGYVMGQTGSTPTGTSTAVPTSMTTVYVPFSLLVPRYFPQPGPSGCGTTPCQSPVFAANHALGFQFSAYPDFSTTGAYNLWIDNVELYTGDTGLNPANPTAASPAFNDGATGWRASCARPTFAPAAGAPNGKYTAAGKYLQWAYRNWKNNYVATGPSAGQLIVKSPEVQGGSVVSEGIAYGMLIAAYMKDQALFDGLWAYWTAHEAGGTHLMNWIYQLNSPNTPTNGGAEGSASDADEDAAFANYVASKLMPTNQATYLANSVAVINDIWSKDFDPANHLPTFGSNSQSSNPTNPSYFAPAYYPIFAAQSGVTAAAAAGFTAATSAVYTALNTISANSLPPAWCSGGNCSTAGGGGFANANDYQYDAHRVPWRVGIDFCWNGSTNASGYLTHISNLFAGMVASSGGVGGGIDTLVDEYQTNGQACTGCTPAAQPNSMSLIGTAAVGALSGSNGPFVNAAWQFVLDGLNRGTPNILATGNNYYTYFNTTVGLLTAMTLSGNFYKL
jgi:endoglucanase